MHLSPFVLELYFDSFDGERLVEGFEELAQRSPFGKNPKPSASPVSLDDEVLLSPAGRARTAIHVCFSDVTEGLWRALKNMPAPTTLAEARRLYENLLDRSFLVGEEDFTRHVERALWWEEELEAIPDDDEPEEDVEPESEDDPTDNTDPDSVVAVGGDDDEALKIWASNIAPISWALHAFAPDAFVPYVFVHRFNQFEAICDELGIPLPRLPGKSSCRDRALYYFELNQALQEFRALHGLSAAQFNAFLYGFCVEHVPAEETDDLPPALRAWFLMATPVPDFDNLDAADEEYSSYWQGNYDSRPGDICVMYCRSPRSSVHSIWRATSAGFADPFFFHYRTVWIGRPVHVPAVTFAELQADATWSKKPAMRAHFQGGSGKEITPQEYEALLAILATKGADMAAIPRLESPPPTEAFDGLQNERDVEQKLFEPLLLSLGYTAADWVRQLPLRMGRGERFYPDYALGVVPRRGEESAKIVAEAKYRIATRAQLHDAYLQARSYAERLRAGVLVLCAMEGVWVFARSSAGFNVERHEHYTWDALRSPQALRSLEDLAGKRAAVWRTRPQP